MAVYKNAVVMFAGGEKIDSATATSDLIVRFEVEMPTFDTSFDQPVSGGTVVVKAPDGYEIASADIADDSSYVTITFDAADDGGGGGSE